MDADPLERVLRVYRVARAARRVRLGHRKLKRMLDDHAAQTDVLLDASELAERIREERVEPEDVRRGARTIVNSAPRMYRAVARHIRNRK